MVLMAACVAIIALAAIWYHRRHEAAQSLVHPVASTTVAHLLPAAHRAKPAIHQAATHPATRPMAVASTPAPTASVSQVVPSALPLVNATPSPAPASTKALTALKNQIATLETQLAALRKGNSQGTAIGHKLSTQVASLDKMIHGINHQIAALSTRFSAHDHSHPVLDGYKLLAILGHRAVIEHLVTGHAAVLSANGQLDELTVYEVRHGRVVTNYGVF